MPNFWEEGKEIGLKQKTLKFPWSLGEFLLFVSETSEHPLYTYTAKVWGKIEKTVVINHFQTYNKFMEEKPLGVAPTPSNQ